MANIMGKSRKTDAPYMVWRAGDWEWRVLKSWQLNSLQPHARWFCDVRTPIVPEGEMGDVYVRDIIGYGELVEFDHSLFRDRETLLKTIAGQA